MKCNIINNEFVFEENKKAPSCHASTVLLTDNGNILSAWFAGEHEGANNVCIWYSIRNQEGIWSKPAIASSEDNIAHWNPVLYKRKDGNIILYYKHGKTISEWITEYVISFDNGLTWSLPKILVPEDTSGGRGPVKNKCLRLTNGTLLAPASTEQNNKWIPFIDISYDDGITWNKQKNMERPRYNGLKVNMIQPSLWQSSDEKVHCLMRSNMGALYRSDSVDNGITWNKPYRTNIPNNNSGIDCQKDKQGRIWLVYNPISIPGGPRSPLNLSLSEDNGKTFKDVLTLENGKGEFSYPAIISKENHLYITYTYKRQKIKFVELLIE